MLDYFYGNETEQYLFYQVPVTLIKEPKFKSLSGDAKLLYGLLLSRTSLSVKNSWMDEQGRVYIIYTIDEIMDDMSCSEKKAIKLTKELKDCDLIETIRRGLNKPNLIYVKNFATVSKSQKQPSNPVNTRNCNFDSSGTVKITVQELSKLQSNYININNNNINKDLQESSSMSSSDSIIELGSNEKTDMTTTADNNISTQTNFSEKKKEPHQTPTDQSKGSKSSFSNLQFSAIDYNAYLEIIKGNISYDSFIQSISDIDLVDDFVACIADTLMTDDDVVVTIGKEKKSIGVIKSVLIKLRYEHIQHAIDQFKSQKHKIIHKRQYIRNTLYNTYHEMNAHYTNAVRADGIVK